MIVVDASAVLELLLKTPQAEDIALRLFREGETVHVPALLDLEVVQVLRRYLARGSLTEARAKLSLDLLSRFPMARYPHDALLPRIWELRANLTAYDAVYVALAEGLRAPLLTCDARLAKAQGVRATIELFSGE